MKEIFNEYTYSKYKSRSSLKAKQEKKLNSILSHIAKYVENTRVFMEQKARDPESGDLNMQNFGGEQWKAIEGMLTDFMERDFQTMMTGQNDANAQDAEGRFSSNISRIQNGNSKLLRLKSAKLRTKNRIKGINKYINQVRTGTLRSIHGGKRATSGKRAGSSRIRIKRKKLERKTDSKQTYNLNPNVRAGSKRQRNRSRKTLCKPEHNEENKEIMIYEEERKEHMKKEKADILEIERVGREKYEADLKTLQKEAQYAQDRAIRDYTHFEKKAKECLKRKDREIKYLETALETKVKNTQSVKTFVQSFLDLKAEKRPWSTVCKKEGWNRQKRGGRRGVRSAVAWRKKGIIHKFLSQAEKDLLLCDVSELLQHSNIQDLREFGDPHKRRVKTMQNRFNTLSLNDPLSKVDNWESLLEQNLSKRIKVLNKDLEWRKSEAERSRMEKIKSKSLAKLDNKSEHFNQSESEDEFENGSNEKNNKEQIASEIRDFNQSIQKMKMQSVGSKTVSREAELLLGEEVRGRLGKWLRMERHNPEKLTEELGRNDEFELQTIERQLANMSNYLESQTVIRREQNLMLKKSGKSVRSNMTSQNGFDSTNTRDLNFTKMRSQHPFSGVSRGSGQRSNQLNNRVRMGFGPNLVDGKRLRPSTAKVTTRNRVISPNLQDNIKHKSKFPRIISSQIGGSGAQSSKFGGSVGRPFSEKVRVREIIYEEIFEDEQQENWDHSNMSRQQRSNHRASKMSNRRRPNSSLRLSQKQSRSRVRGGSRLQDLGSGLSRPQSMMHQLNRPQTPLSTWKVPKVKTAFSKKYDALTRGVIDDVGDVLESQKSRYNTTRSKMIDQRLRQFDNHIMKGYFKSGLNNDASTRISSAFSSSNLVFFISLISFYFKYFRNIYIMIIESF